MGVRIVPEAAGRADWPRLIAQAVNALIRRSETLTLDKLADYADDTAAATGGVLVGGYYRSGSVLKVRVS